MLPTHYGVPHGDVPRGKPIRLVTSGLHSQYTHAGGRLFNFVPGFHSQDNYSPRDRKEYSSFLSMIEPTAIALKFRFFQKTERGLT